MKEELKVNTPNAMKLGKTTFSFERNLIANTMQLHQVTGKNLLNPSYITKMRIKYAEQYLKVFNSCENLCEKAIKRNKSKNKKIDVANIVANYSKKSLKRTTDNVISM